MSFLIRKETSDNDEVAVKLAESDIAWNAQNAGIEIGYFGDIYSMENGVKQWTLKYYGEVTTPRGGKIYTTLYKNLGPMIVGQTALVVLNIEFLGAPIPTDPSYRPAAVTALLNPNANTLGKTITLNQSDRVFVISKQFRNIVFYGGNTKAKGSMDEFRIGNSYAAVTPTTTYNLVDIRYAANYYPFGSPMPGRNFTAGLAYRYGFNGKENDPEIEGQQDYGFRIYDKRLGRFKSVDPLTSDFPWNSTYSYAEGNPIKFIDLDGLERAYFDVGSGTIIPASDRNNNGNPVGMKIKDVKLTSAESIYLQTKRMAQPTLSAAPSFYEKLKSNVPRESFLIGQGIGHGLSVTELPIGISSGLLFSKAALFKGLASASTGALTTALYYKGDASKIDIADFGVTAVSEFIKNPLLKAAFKVGVSSTVDLKLKANQVNFENSFDGSKGFDKTIIDIAANTSFYNNPLKINNQIGSDLFKGVLKSASKDIATTTTETK